ncbi:MAG: hypothetical protein ABFS35_00410 [Bacteroidota bacterium]
MHTKLKTITILIFIFSNWAELAAQITIEDVVYLKNGTVIRGKILKNENDSIKIETHCRNIFVYKSSDLLKVSKESYNLENKPAPELNQKGIYNITTIGFLTGNSELADAQTFTFQSTLGYNYNQYIGAGVGVGIEKLRTELVPVFISLKSNMLNKANSPVLNLTFGYSFPLSKEKKDENQEFSYEGGINFGFDIGICSYKTQKRALLITAGYRYQIVKESFSSTSWYYPNSTEKNTYKFNKIAIKIGFMFI